MSDSCVECGGPVVPRVSGFNACQKCGKLVVAPVEDEREASKGETITAAYDVVVPDFTECLVGWRAWGVDPAAIETGYLPVLRSVSFTEAFWTPRRPMRAVCDAGDDHVPGESCDCGLYSAKTLEHLMSMSYHQYDARGKGLFHVVGSVALWGKVIEGTQGWRAEIGYPRELFVPYEAHRLMGPLADAYGVPVRLKNILRLEEVA